MRDEVAREIDEKRRQAWIERGRIREPDPVPLRYPLVQTLVLGGVTAGTVGEKDDRDGVLVVQGSLASRVIPSRWFAIELGGAVSTTMISGPIERYRTIHIQPAFLVCGCNGEPETVHTVVPWLRAAIDIGLPIDGGTRTPDATVAIKIGAEVDMLVARFGDGGFAAAVLQFNGVFRFAAGGETSLLRKPVGGIEVLVGPSIAF